MTRSEIGIFGEEDEKYCTRKYNQYVTHLKPTCNNVLLTCDSSITKALEQHECGHTPFLIATGLNMVITRIKLKY